MEVPVKGAFEGCPSAELANSFNKDAVERIASSTTAELGGAIWALLLIYHDDEAYNCGMHRDSKIAIYLAAGHRRPHSNYKLVTIARALCDEVAAIKNLDIKRKKDHSGDPRNELGDATAPAAAGVDDPAWDLVAIADYLKVTDGLKWQRVLHVPT